MTLLVGDNTDGKGFLSSLRSLTDPTGKSAVVIGAGGAARAIVAELSLAGAARIIVVNRTLGKRRGGRRGRRRTAARPRS